MKSTKDPWIQNTETLTNQRGVLQEFNVELTYERARFSRKSCVSTEEWNWTRSFSWEFGFQYCLASSYINISLRKCILHLLFKWGHFRCIYRKLIGIRNQIKVMKSSSVSALLVKLHIFAAKLIQVPLKGDVCNEFASNHRQHLKCNSEKKSCNFSYILASFPLSESALMQFWDQVWSRLPQQE